MLQMMLSFFLVLNSSLPVLAQPETVLERIKRTGLLRVAMREDAAPFGYRNLDNRLSGICLDFFNVLRRSLQQELKLQALSINLSKSTLYNRFQIVQEGSIDLECGPNTIREDQPVAFSAPFFITGTQFLIHKDQQKKFNVNGSLANVTLGVLRDTTTAQLIQSRYSQAKIQQFQGVTGRRRGVQAVLNGRIEGFASDGILLIGEATIQGLSLQQYILVPSPPLDCEYYGLILPKNDPQWRDFVNSVLKNTQSKELLQEWFTLLDPYIRETMSYCTIDILPR